MLFSILGFQGCGRSVEGEERNCLETKQSSLKLTNLTSKLHPSNHFQPPPSLTASTFPPSPPPSLQSLPPTTSNPPHGRPPHHRPLRSRNLLPPLLLLIPPPPPPPLLPRLSVPRVSLKPQERGTVLSLPHPPRDPRVRRRSLQPELPPRPVLAVRAHSPLRPLRSLLHHSPRRKPRRCSPRSHPPLPLLSPRLLPRPLGVPRGPREKRGREGRGLPLASGWCKRCGGGLGGGRRGSAGGWGGGGWEETGW